MIWLLTIGLLLVALFSLRFNWWRKPVSSAYPRILMYHSIAAPIAGAGRKFNKWRVSPDSFEKQITWMAKNGWQSFTVSELMSLKQIPKKAVCITFDDGYADNFTVALPILEKYQFKATIYLVTDCQHNDWVAMPEGRSNEPLLSKQQMSALQQSGLIELGSHTLHHADLTSLDDAGVKLEIERSKQKIEALLETECKAFAYPYGRHNEQIAKQLSNAGYASAVTVKRGVANIESPFKLNRIAVLGSECFFDFYLRMTRVKNKGL